MRPSFRPLGPMLILAALLGLAACDSAEERAERHYQRGVALLAEGDADRALVEFRNVFRLDGDHIPARLAFAGVQRARGVTREAMGQYLRVADQDPANLEAQRAVVEIALEMQDFPTAEEHAAEAFVQAPADPMVRALKATVDFRHPATRAEAVAMAEAVVAEAPGQRRGPDGADRRPPQRRRAGAGAHDHRRGAGAGARGQGPAPGAPRRARGGRRHGRRRRRARPAWPSSSPTTPGCGAA